jgi:CPA2 family monovalent cation:H+ antiporter-2
VLIQAHIAEAAMLVVALPDALAARQMVLTARTLNPGIEVVLRSPDADAGEQLRREADGTVFSSEEELARGMAGHVTARFERPAGEAHSAG